MSLYKQSYGGRGCKVRVWEPRKGGNFMIAPFMDGEYRDPQSLGHRDTKLAEDAAYALIHELKSGREQVAEPSKLTLATLVGMYLASDTFAALKPKQQSEKKALLERIVAHLGSTKRVLALDDDAVKGLLSARRHGKRGFKKAGVQAVYQCYCQLRSVVLWAYQKKNASGQRILTENPLEGMPKRLGIRPNKAPMQPIIAHDTFEVLRRAGRSLPMYMRVFLIVAEGTGRREGAMRELQWPDVRDDTGEIFWSGEFDKMELEMERVAMPRVMRYLKVWRRHCPSDTWVFPAPRDHDVQVPKETVDKWLSLFYDAAGLRKPKRCNWHAFRRKWVTERDGWPLKTLMAAGGWESEQSILRYLKTDKRQVTAAILNPTRRVTAPKLERRLEQVEKGEKKVRFKAVS